MNRQKVRMLSTTILCFLVLFSVIVYPLKVRAEYPEKPLSLVVGFEAGATVDIIARALTLGAKTILKQPIVIENKGGGGGTVALSILATTKPDGYTVTAVTSSALINAPLMQKVPFKPLKSFTPIMGHSISEHTALLVHKDAPWKTLNEFLEYAKKNPGKVKYSTAGVGTDMHVAMNYIAYKEGIKWVHVPYKGQAPARTALMGGHVDACSSGVDWGPFMQSGALRVLATYGRKRAPYSPDIPTLKELGYDFVSESIHSIVGPAGLPQDVVRKLEMAFTKGTETPEFKTAQENLSLTAAYYNSQEYDRHLKEKWVRMEKLFRDTAIIKEAATLPD